MKDFGELMFFLSLSLQFGGRAEGVHEEQNAGLFLPGKTDDPESLVTSGDVPAQTGAEDPQISPVAAGEKHATLKLSPR